MLGRAANFAARLYSTNVLYATKLRRMHGTTDAVHRAGTMARPRRQPTQEKSEGGRGKLEDLRARQIREELERKFGTPNRHLAPPPSRGEVGRGVHPFRGRRYGRPINPEAAEQIRRSRIKPIGYEEGSMPRIGRE